MTLHHQTQHHLLQARQKAQLKAQQDTDNVIKIGATATPHGEILEFVKDKLAKEGYDLQITIYDDYVLPNNAVASGELDANYHQHTPYLNNYNEKNGTDIVPAALIHYEPFGLYGNGVEKLADVKKGASIQIIPAEMTATKQERFFSYGRGRSYRGFPEECKR